MSPAGRAKKIGFIPQIHTPTFPYTVLQVVLMGRTPHLNMIALPSESDYRIAENAIRTVNIEYIRDVPYTELSGGQMQLVLMARVLAQEPEILLLDEPTSHLDVGNQIRVIEMVKMLAARGLSVVMTSHFPDHAFLAANRVGILKDKSFIAMGDADEVVTEQNLKATYGVDMRIVYMGGDINRKIAVPVVVNGQAGRMSGQVVVNDKGGIVTWIRMIQCLHGPDRARPDQAGGKGSLEQGQ